MDMEMEQQNNDLDPRIQVKQSNTYTPIKSNALTILKYL